MWERSLGDVGEHGVPEMWESRTESQRLVSRESLRWVRTESLRWVNTESQVCEDGVPEMGEHGATG